MSAQPTLEDITLKLTERLAELVNLNQTELDPKKSLDTYGLDSVAAVGLSGELEEWYDASFPPELLKDYSTLESLAGHVFQKLQADRP